MTRMLAGDITVARHRPLRRGDRAQPEGLRLAAELGDAVAESDFRTRLVVLDATRLRLTDARSRAEAGVRAARATTFPEVVARSLDGLKTVHAYCGDTAALRVVLDELVPLLADLRLPWLMQWAVLESSLVPAGSSDWPEARRRVDAALEVNRETGYDAYTGFFRAQRGWLARLSGDLEAATNDGRRSVAETSPADHPWWYATAVGATPRPCSSSGAATRRPSSASPGSPRSATRPGRPTGCAAWHLWPPPRARGWSRPTALLAGVQAPPGQAWVAGADVYDAVATAWLRRRRARPGSRRPRPLLEATTHSWREVHERAARATSAATRPAASEELAEQPSRPGGPVLRYRHVVERRAPAPRRGRRRSRPGPARRVVHGHDRRRAARAGAARGPAARSGGAAGSRGTDARWRSAPWWSTARPGRWRRRRRRGAGRGRGGSRAPGPRTAPGRTPGRAGDR